jgi:hypothetical protein
VQFPAVKELPLELVKASATPWLGTDPFSQPCASGVMSIRMNWFKLTL